jgi:uncharacterized peroxidase-related enzyme
MAYIQIIEEENAGKELKEIYSKVKGNRGKLSNIMKIHSLNPKTMKTHLDFYMSLLFGKSGLSREERELIGVVVSSANDCKYCVKHHAEALNHYWKDNSKIELIAKNYHEAGLDKRFLSIAEFAYKLTKSPANMNEIDVQNLRDAGLTDEEILTTNLIAGYFNFVNRSVLGLGVEFSEEEITGYKY